MPSYLLLSSAAPLVSRLAPEWDLHRQSADLDETPLGCRLSSVEARSVFSIFLETRSSLPASTSYLPHPPRAAIAAGMDPNANLKRYAGPLAVIRSAFGRLRILAKIPSTCAAVILLRTLPVHTGLALLKAAEVKVVDVRWNRRSVHE